MRSSTPACCERRRRRSIVLLRAKPSMPSIRALEARSDALSVWLIAWTAVVAVGLVIEYGPPMYWFVGAIFRKIVHNESIGQPKETHWSATILGGVLIT